MGTSPNRYGNRIIYSFTPEGISQKEDLAFPYCEKEGGCPVRSMLSIPALRAAARFPSF